MDPTTQVNLSLWKNIQKTNFFEGKLKLGIWRVGRMGKWGCGKGEELGEAQGKGLANGDDHSMVLTEHLLKAGSRNWLVQLYFQFGWMFSVLLQWVLSGIASDASQEQIDSSRSTFNSSFNLSISSVQVLTISQILLQFWVLNSLKASFSSLNSSISLLWSIMILSYSDLSLSKCLCALSNVSIILLISISYFSTSNRFLFTQVCFHSSSSSQAYCCQLMVLSRREIFYWQQVLSSSIALLSQRLSAQSCFTLVQRGFWW